MILPHVVDEDEDERYFQFGRLWQLYVPLPPAGGQPECDILLCKTTPYAVKYSQLSGSSALLVIMVDGITAILYYEITDLWAK